MIGLVNPVSPEPARMAGAGARPAAVALPAGSPGADLLVDLSRQARVLDAQIQSTSARITVLTERRAQAKAELAAAQKAIKSLTPQVRSAKATVKESARTLKGAEATLQERDAARAAAQGEVDSAAKQLGAAQDRLAKVTKSAVRSANVESKAHKRVRKAKPGSKKHAKSFTRWQMAAIEARAGHARQVLADDLASDLHVGVEAADAALTGADYALRQARVQQKTAARAHAKAESRQAELTTDLAAARADTKALKPEVKQVAASLKSASSSLRKQEAQRRRLDGRVDRATEALTASTSKRGG